MTPLLGMTVLSFLSGMKDTDMWRQKWQRWRVKWTFGSLFPARPPVHGRVHRTRAMSAWGVLLAVGRRQAGDQGQGSWPGTPAVHVNCRRVCEFSSEPSSMPFPPRRQRLWAALSASNRVPNTCSFPRTFLVAASLPSSLERYLETET